MAQWFDKSPRFVNTVTSDMGGPVSSDSPPSATAFQPRQPGMLSKFSAIGNAALAPWVQAYGGNMEYQLAQQKLQMQQDQADMEFQKYLIASGNGKPLFTVDPVTGMPQQIGVLPKGSQFVAPASMETSGEKISNAVTKSELTKAAEILPKMDQALEAVNSLKSQYYSGFKPSTVEKGDVKSGLKARGRGIIEGAKAGAGASPELETFKNNRGAFASLISKGGFLEAGVLTNQDIQRVLKAIPSEYSTEKEAELGWNSVTDILGKARQRYDKKLSDATGGVKEQKSQNDDKYQQYLKIISGTK